MCWGLLLPFIYLFITRHDHSKNYDPIRLLTSYASIIHYLVIIAWSICILSLIESVLLTFQSAIFLHLNDPGMSQK